MRNIALQLMYVGTAYHGWQIQNNAATVQETLEQAVAKVVKHPVRFTGAGRTDAGVHARVYIANFRTSCNIPCDRMPLAFNARLPEDIVVVSAREVSEGFNAIGSCLKKEYTYQVYNSRIRNAFYVDRAYFWMGLSIPQVTQVFQRLKELGLPIQDDCVYTMDEAREALLALYRKGVV